MDIWQRGTGDTHRRIDARARVAIFAESLKIPKPAERGHIVSTGGVTRNAVNDTAMLTGSRGAGREKLKKMMAANPDLWTHVWISPIALMQAPAL